MAAIFNTKTSRVVVLISVVLVVAFYPVLARTFDSIANINANDVKQTIDNAEANSMLNNFNNNNNNNKLVLNDVVNLSDEAQDNTAGNETCGFCCKVP
jgi:Skp family chaperone for outer membrane proteins